MNNIKQLRDELGISMKEVSTHLKIPYTTYVNYEKGTREPNSEMLIKLAKYFDVSVDYLIGRDDVKKHYKEETTPLPPNFEAYTPGLPVKVIGTIRCGYGYIAFEDEDGVELANVNNPDEYRWLKVTGDSMEPRIHDGDLALIKLQSDIDSGDVAAVIVNGNEGTLKKVTKQDGAILLQPFNANCNPQLIAGEKLKELHIVGKLVETKTKW